MITTIPPVTGEGPKTYRANRVCANESCSTVLSRYTRTRRCWQHSNKAERLSLREHQEAMFSLADLMEQAD